LAEGHGHPLGLMNFWSVLVQMSQMVKHRGKALHFHTVRQSGLSNRTSEPGKVAELMVFHRLFSIWSKGERADWTIGNSRRNGKTPYRTWGSN
jgi:hypothetical protein